MTGLEDLVVYVEDADALYDRVRGEYWAGDSPQQQYHEMRGCHGAWDEIPWVKAVKAGLVPCDTCCYSFGDARECPHCGGRLPERSKQG